MCSSAASDRPAACRRLARPCVRACIPVSAWPVRAMGMGSPGCVAVAAFSAPSLPLGCAGLCLSCACWSPGCVAVAVLPGAALPRNATCVPHCPSIWWHQQVVGRRATPKKAPQLAFSLQPSLLLLLAPSSNTQKGAPCCYAYPLPAPVTAAAAAAQPPNPALLPAAGHTHAHTAPPAAACALYLGGALWALLPCCLCTRSSL